MTLQNNSAAARADKRGEAAFDSPLDKAVRALALAAVLTLTAVLIALGFFSLPGGTALAQTGAEAPDTDTITAGQSARISEVP